MSSPTSYRLFAILCGISILLWWSALAEVFSLAINNGAYTHILLILPISFVLIGLQWRKRVLTPQSNVRAGAALLALAALAGLSGWQWAKASPFGHEIRLTIEMAALVTWWIASFVLCFGGRAFRHCLLPLLFLFWLVPMPAFVLSQVVKGLQEGTASVARVFFVISGVPVSQNGTILSVPGVTVEVAEECSSIRSSMMLVVTSMVMSYILLRSFWGRTIVTLAALPLAIAKNGLRVFTLAALAAYVDPAVLKSWLHRQGGVLFFAVALAAVAALICLLARLERRQMYIAKMRLSYPTVP